MTNKNKCLLYKYLFFSIIMNKKVFFIWLISGVAIMSLIWATMYNKVTVVDVNDLMSTNNAQWLDNWFKTQDYECEKQCHETKRSCLNNVVKTTKWWSDEFVKGFNMCHEELINCVKECKIKDLESEWGLTEEQKKQIAHDECMIKAKNELQICFENIPKFISGKKFQKLALLCHESFIKASNICLELLK